MFDRVTQRRSQGSEHGVIWRVAGNGHLAREPTVMNRKSPYLRDYVVDRSWIFFLLIIRNHDILKWVYGIDANPFAWEQITLLQNYIFISGPYTLLLQNHICIYLFAFIEMNFIHFYIRSFAYVQY